MKKSHVVLAALALTVGFGSAFAVDAASYKDIATVAEGVYVAHGDAGTFKVQAEDPVTAVIYDHNGDLLLARNMAAGEARTFLVGDAAVVAIAGGQAKVSAKGDGAIEKIGKTMRTIPLDESSGAVDESFTVRMPAFLVGLQGRVDGEAENLVVEIVSSKGLVYRYADGEVTADLSMLTKEPMDARITADKLDGRIVLDLYVADFEGLERHRAHAESAPMPTPKTPHPHKERPGMHAEAAPKAKERPTTLAFEEIQGTPVKLVLDRASEIAVRIEGGYGVDASLYDAAGQMVQYLQRGITVAEARQHGNFLGPFDGSRSYEDVMPEEIAWTLESGEYLLFVRLGHVDGSIALGNVREVVPLEPITVDDAAEDGASWTFDAPVLDILVWDYEPAVNSRLALSLNGATVYETSAALTLFGGFDAERQTMYEPGLLGIGTIEVAYDALGVPGNGPHISLIVAGEPVQEEDEDDN